MILWFVLLAVAVPLLHFAMRVKPADPLPAHWQLPEAFGAWQGEHLYYSTDPEVSRVFREADILEPGVCPVSGASLDTVSPAERRLLPDDVLIDRRMYRQPPDLYRHVIMLITGASREGIHRPEWCLTAQGIRIGRLRHLRIETEAGDRFDVGVYPMFSRHAPESAPPSGYFVYWYEGPNTRTAYNFVRILRMGWDRLRSGRVQRWAYFSIQMNLPAGAVDVEDRIADAVEWLLRGRAQAAGRPPATSQ